MNNKLQIIAGTVILSDLMTIAGKAEVLEALKLHFSPLMHPELMTGSLAKLQLETSSVRYKFFKTKLADIFQLLMSRLF